MALFQKACIRALRPLQKVRRDLYLKAAVTKEAGCCTVLVPYRMFGPVALWQTTSNMKMKHPGLNSGLEQIARSRHNWERINEVTMTTDTLIRAMTFSF